MNQLFLSLQMKLEPNAPEGPGWYIVASGDAELIPPTRVSPRAAQLIAQGFEEVAIAVAGDKLAATPTQMIGSGNRLIRQTVEQELRFAEEQASRIKGLRTHLQMLEGSSDTVEGTPRRETGEESV